MFDEYLIVSPLMSLLIISHFKFGFTFCSSYINIINLLENELKTFYEKKKEGAMIRAKAKCQKDAEKNTKYLFQFRKTKLSMFDEYLIVSPLMSLLIISHFKFGFTFCSSYMFFLFLY
jgi:hypothetical protein